MAPHSGEEIRFTVSDRELLIRLDEKLDMFCEKLDGLRVSVDKVVPEILVHEERISNLEASRRRIVGTALTLGAGLILLGVERLWNFLKLAMEHIAGTPPIGG